MKRKLLAAIGLSLATSWSIASAESLNIYNWTDYTSPELVKKFEKETGIDVTLDTYDSNETLLAKLKGGATGYDIVVPSQHFVKIMAGEGLLQDVDVPSMANYKNVDERWQKPSWDPDQKYSVPWQWGSASFTFRTGSYSGKGESLKEFFEPSEELKGRIQVFKSPDEAVNLAHLYLGSDFCTEDTAAMKKVQALLLKQKESVLLYSSENMNDRLANKEVLMAAGWNGDSMKGRLEHSKDQVYAYPKEGIVGWFDSAVVPKGAKNVEGAKKFMNFIMDPENIAIQSNFAKYSNGIVGSEAYFGDDMKDAPELNVPKEIPVKFGEACSPKAQKLVEKVWTKLLQ